MTVGPVGKDTNVSPQNYVGVPPKQGQVGEFKGALNRATTSNDASGTQSSKGTEHSQDTSKSLPIILATRPPINLGNPIGKQGAPLNQSQAPAAPAANAAPGVQSDTSTPLPKDAVVDKKTKVASDSQSQLQSNLKEGMKGKDVEKLQDQLIQLGYVTKGEKETGSGIFGPKTEKALKEFQRDHKLDPDGILGPQTRKALQGTGTEKKEQAPAQTGASQVQTEKPAAKYTGAKEVPDSQLGTERSAEDQAKLYDKYEKLIPEGKLKSGPNEMNIVGLRHHDIGSSKDLRSYDDRFVVMWKDDAGQKHVQVFEGATHTGQKSTKGNFTDVDKDGKADIAHIEPGTYDFHMGKSSKYGDHLRPDQKIGAWRDTNQDGKITGDERDTNYKATAILFHEGGETAPISVGCQTLAPDEYQRFIDLIKQDPNDKVTYTLADA